MFDDTSCCHAGDGQVGIPGTSITTKLPAQLIARLPAATKLSMPSRMSNVGSLTLLTIIVYAGLLLLLTLLTSVD